MYQQPDSQGSGGYPQMSHLGPPPSNYGGMSQGQYTAGSQYGQYPPMPPPQQHQPQPQPQQPPPTVVLPQQSMAPSTQGGPPGPQMSAYSPPPIPNANTSNNDRPVSNYTAGPPASMAANTNRPSRPSRPPRSQTGNSQRHRSERARTNYGHLVNEEPKHDVACSGDACGSCCWYNVLGCSFCCNGWLRLFGRGLSVQEITGIK
ncbi:hypothetical protein GQ54DRAFT_126152 [Martensiomyces pterosporus]|nr:hypothetical protein GQ54DRAFT_126152 [Martensiomyces pterosporus]